MESSNLEKEVEIDALYRELTVEVYNSWDAQKTEHFRNLLMGIPSNYDNFMNLSREDQTVIVREESCFTAATLRNFLSTYSLIDVDDISAVWGCGWNAEEFFNLIGAADGDEPSLQFLSFSYVHSWTIGQSEIPMYAVLYVLRSAFGEDIVMETCSLLQSAGLLWWDHDIVEICRNWSDLKHQPVKWISSIYGSPSLEDEYSSSLP